jgi:uridylate kinase
MIKKRILIKISGESLSLNKDKIHDVEILNYISSNIVKLLEDDYTVAIVIGGGNIYRGSCEKIKVSRVNGDYIGMLATIINAVVIFEHMKEKNIDCRLMSSLPIRKVCEDYSYNKALDYLENKKVVIFAGGTGNPFCTTDSAAVLKAIEMKCDLVLKATNVDGVYSDDPKKNPDSIRYSHITYEEVIRNKLRVMDIGSVTMAQEFKLPIKIFSMGSDFSDIINDIGKYTLISED